MKILVPLDGSPFSEAILKPVIQMAEAVDAEVHLLTVVEEPRIRSTWIEALAMGDEGTGGFGMTAPLRVSPPSESGVDIGKAGTPKVSPPSESGAHSGSEGQSLEGALHAAGEYLTQVAGRFSSSRAKTETIVGDNPVGVILSYSQEQGIDLIAMSTHGRSGLGRWVFGSVADKLLHSTPLPLLLISPTDDCQTSLEGAPIDTLVVPLDGSELAESALPYVENLARQMALKISLIRVVSTPALTYPGAEGYAYDPKMFADIENAATAYLRQKRSELERKGFRVEHTVKGGYPADYIVDFAEAREGSLIVMSTHGRSGVGRWLMGSVADRVLRASCRPILLVRPKTQTS